jgi:mRNA interferase RelE/StbE
MSYKLKFLPVALKEWKKLSPPLQGQFKKKLRERLVNPHVPASRLSGFTNIYKIKLRSIGYRLVYEVSDKNLVVYVLAIEKRGRGDVYKRVYGRYKG